MGFKEFYSVAQMRTDNPVHLFIKARQVSDI